MILVMRCAHGPPAVESDIVQCSECKQNCWLSKFSGNQSRRLAIMLGDDRIICCECYGWDLGI